MRTDDIGFDDELEGDEMPDESAEVDCPYCGETVEILLDAGGGMTQEYVEDCEVCCQPWRVMVWYDETGTATVVVEPLEQ